MQSSEWNTSGHKKTHLLVFLQALNISRTVGKIGKLLEHIWQYDMGVIPW